MTIDTTNKTSFILYHDICKMFFELTDEQAGQLIKDIVRYSVNKTQSPPVEPTGLSGLLSTISIPFKSHIDRDFEKYLIICERNKNNGQKGGKPKKIKTQSPPVEPDNDTDTDNGNDTVKDKDNDINIQFGEFYKLYPLKKSPKKAEVSFARALKEVTFEEIITGLKNYLAHIEKKKIAPEYIKHPATWLNQQCWEDEYEPVKVETEEERKSREWIEEATRLENEYHAMVMAQQREVWNKQAEERELKARASHE